MQNHRFHRTIGKLVDRLAPSLGTGYWKAPECEGPKRVPLLHCEQSKCVQFCLVDMLIIQPDKIVVIEIEESDVKPLHLFGKFFASAHATHHGDTEIAKLPLLFIQVLLEPERTRKGEQWDCIKQILKGHATEWKGRKGEYELVRGKWSDFEDGGKAGKVLLDLTSKFLGRGLA